MDLTDDQKAFIEEIARRVPPPPNVVIKTRNGPLVVTQKEKAKLDLIASGVGLNAENLVDSYSPPR